MGWPLGRTAAAELRNRGRWPPPYAGYILPIGATLLYLVPVVIAPASLNLEGESYSIGNQKKLLTKVAKEKGYTNLVHFLDDGISGVTMDRPGFVEMIQQLEQGRAAAVFVKDLSRLGRNYIEVGRLTEEFFPEHDIRLVAVSDNIDTAEGENELAPIRNLFKNISCLGRVFC